MRTIFWNQGSNIQLVFGSYRNKEITFLLSASSFLKEQSRESAYFIDKEERLQIRLTGEVQKEDSQPKLFMRY